MKKFAFIALLLAMALTACACTTSSTNPQQTQSQETENTAPTHVGIWRAENANRMIELASDGTATYYTLKEGYDTYFEKRSGSYTEQDGSLTLSLEDGTTLTLLYNQAEDQLSFENMACKRVEALPAAHNNVAFPDFASLELSAMVSLGDYKNLTKPANAQAHAYQKLFDQMYQSTSKPIIKADKIAEQGDFVNIDYIGKLDGVAFAGGTANDQNVWITSDNGYIPGFADGIVGHRVGDTFDVNVTFPTDYHSADLAGQSVVFTMTLNAVYDTDRKAVLGDYVNIDYTGKLKDGTVFQGGSATDQSVLIAPDSGYIPGFAEGIAEHTIGETFDVEVTFPTDYHSTDLAGQSVVFTMTLNAIYDPNAITDEAVQNATNGAYQTKDAYLKVFLDDYLGEYYWNTLSENTSVLDITEDAYGFFYQYYRDYYHEYASYYNISYETLLSYNGITESLFVDAAKNDSLTYILAFLIAKAENITYSEDALELKWQTVSALAAEEYNCSPEYASRLLETTYKRQIRAELILEAVTDWLIDQNN